MSRLHLLLAALLVAPFTTSASLAAVTQKSIISPSVSSRTVSTICSREVFDASITALAP